MDTKIDIVIPWVDGNDADWLADKAKYTVEMNEDNHINRYRDWELLRYWFRGIEKYAPWVNKVHFITYGHLPDWLNTNCEKLNVVNHRDYIPKKYLPVFSSHPIELNMHRIKDLAEHFVYFNDDMFVINELHPKDFFVGGIPADAVVEVPLRFNPGGIDHIIANNMTLINKHFEKRKVIANNKRQWFSIKNMNAYLKNLYMLPINGFSAFDNPHLPIPYLKSTLEKVWLEEKTELDYTSSHKFRSTEDVNQWLFRYWQFAEGNFVQSKTKGKFFSIGKDDGIIEDAISSQKYKIICLSDDSLDVDFDKEQKFLENLFLQIFPDKSAFEK